MVSVEMAKTDIRLKETWNLLSSLLFNLHSPKIHNNIT
jgi:hypothetical protein